MKKSFIPATIAALAISLTSIAAPPAIANEANQAENQSAEADVSLKAGESVTYYVGTMLKDMNPEFELADHSSINEYKFTTKNGAQPFTYTFEGKQPTAKKDRQLAVKEGTTPGVYEVDVELTTTTVGKEKLEGKLTIEVTGVALTGKAKALDATDTSQDTGLKLVEQAVSPEVVVKDAADETIKHEVSADGTITVAPGKDAVGPLTVTVDDESLAAPLTASIPLRVTATQSPANYVVKADGKRWFSGVSLTQNTGATKVTATDKNGKTVKSDVGSDGRIFLTTTEDLVGPITLKVTDPTLEGGSKSFTIKVLDDEEGGDDGAVTEEEGSENEGTKGDGTGNNGSETDEDSETDEISVSGEAKEVISNGKPQFTGLTLVNGTEDTVVTAKDKEGTDVTVTLAEDGKISVTPKAGAVSPITITVADESLEKDLTEKVVVKAPAADENPLSSNGGLIALGAVLAAVIGIIGAIATRIIQLPF